MDVRLKKAFITGITGQDGSYLAEHLLKENYEVAGLVRRSSVAENQTFRINSLLDDVKTYYGDLTEKQFRRIYTKASNIKGDTSQILIELLERRLDAIVYRMKFVPTIFAARQLVNHGHVKVNGKRVNIPSFSVKDGDEIELKDGSKEINIVQESIVSQEREIPEYIEVDVKEFKGRFLRAPLIHDVPYPVTMEPNLVIEFYSR